MKKGLFILPYLYMGGAETQFRNLIQGLQDEIELTVYILGKFNKEDIFLKDNPKVKFKKIGFLFKENYKTKIGKFLSYIFNYIFITLYLLYEYFFLRRKYKFVITYQEILAPLIPVLFIISEKLIFSIRSASRKLKKRKYLKILFNLCDIIVSNSYEGEKYLKEIGIKNTKVIINGICSSKKYIEVSLVPKKFKNIYIVARIHPLKNQMIVLKAFKDLDVNLNFIGKNTNDLYKKELEEYIRENNLQKKVKFINYNQNMKDIWNNADLIILPSLEEGIANIILESYYNRKLILFSNIPENIFLKRKEERLFNPHNENDLKEKLFLLENEEKMILKKELDRNYTYVINTFDLNKMINNYKKILNC